MKLTNQKTVLLLIAILIAIGMFFRSLGKSAGPLSKSTRSLIFDKQPPEIHIDTTAAEPTINLENSIHLAASYLIQQNDNSGKFNYRLNTNPEINVSKRYNMLRHAGTIYALASYARYFNDSQAREALLRGSRFLKKQLKFVDIDSPILAVFSDPIINRSDDPLQAKLGGTGLGLVALCSADLFQPGFTALDTLRMMGEFIRYMQKEDGSFHSKYFPDNQNGRDDSWTSLYYPGEAVLGLLMLYEVNPDTIWLETAKNGLLYLARTRENLSSVPADHWALIATDRLLKSDIRILPVEKRLIVNHLLQITGNIIDNIPKHPANHPFFGCLSKDGRTTPTATRLEGLLAALPYLNEYKPQDAEQALTIIKDGIEFLMKSQIRSRQYMGGIPRATKALDTDHPGYSKSFNRRHSEIRIDYVQHALSALIEYNSLQN